MPRGTSDRDSLLLQGRLWTPSQIDTGTALSGSLLGWYDAMDFSTINATSGSVDSWTDKSAFRRNVANVTTQRPTFSPTGAKGWPGLTVTATQGLFHSTPYMFTAADSGPGLTVCCVSYGQTTAAGALLGEASTASNNPIFAPLFVIAGLQAAFQQRNDANTTSTGSTSLLGTPQTYGTTVWSLQTNTIPAGSGSVVTGRAYGVVGGSPRTRTYSGAYTLTSFSLCGYYRVGNAITTAEPGTVCEYVVIAGTNLRTLQLVEGYLAWKWPTLASLNEDHPFVNRPPEIGQ